MRLIAIYWIYFAQFNLLLNGTKLHFNFLPQFVFHFVKRLASVRNFHDKETAQLLLNSCYIRLVFFSVRLSEKCAATVRSRVKESVHLHSLMVYWPLFHFLLRNCSILFYFIGVMLMAKFSTTHLMKFLNVLRLSNSKWASWIVPLRCMENFSSQKNW